MSEETLSLVERLRRRLRDTVRRLTLGELAFGAVVTLGAAAGLWLFSSAAEASFWLGSGGRLALVVVVVVVVVGLVAVYVARPLGRLAGLLTGPSDEDAARRVGRHFPDAIADRFVNLLQLAGGGASDQRPSGALADRAVTHLGREVERVEFESIEDFARARRAARFAALPVAGLLLFLLAAPTTFLSASGRLLAPTEHFQRPAAFRLSLAPGTADLVRGDSLAVTARAEGQRLPARVTLQVQAGGEDHVEELTLSPARSGVAADSAGRVKGREARRFRHVFGGVRQSFRYRAVAETGGRPLRTGWHEARVTGRPRVGQLQVTLAPPAYSGLPERTLAPGTGDVAALPGTEITVEAALAGPPARQALLRFAAEDRSTSDVVDTLRIDDGAARGAFTLRTAGRYHVALQSEGGTPNAAPIRYRVRPTADAAPTVSLTAPQPGAALTDARRPEVHWQMSDDFGFAAQKLYWRLAERRYGDAMGDFESIDVPTAQPGLLDQAVAYDWRLAETTGRDLVPGDVIEYYVRVWDNNAVAGYQSARTQTRRLRLPSTAEKYQELDKTQSGVDEEMQRLEEESEQARQQFEGLRDEIRRKREGDWEDRRQVEQLEQRQQQLQEGAERLTRQIEEAAQQMQQGQLTSPETQRQYRELQRVAREMQSPELQEALEKLRQSMQEMDMQKMQQAMEDFQFNEEQYRERLQRTRELLEKLQTQRKLEEVAERAGELAEEEKRLAEETKRLQEDGGTDSRPNDGEQSSGENRDGENRDGENRDGEKQNAERPSGEGEKQTPGAAQQPAEEDTAGEKRGQQQSEAERERLAEAQDAAREKMQQLHEEMQKLSEQMQQQRGTPKEQMQQMQQQSGQMPQQMQQNSQQLRQGQMQEAQQGQQQMQQQLQQMQQAMSQMQQSMKQQQKQINMAGLRQALANTLRLSEDQEALRQRTRGLAPGSPALRAVTRRQNELAEGLRTTTDSLTVLAREIPKMTRAVQKESGEALRAMGQATESMTSRTAQRAGGHQKTAMKNLNELALLLSQTMQQMQQGGQGGQGSMSAQQMMQQLQQMAGQQQQLNGQIQQMLNDMQGERLSRQQEGQKPGQQGEEGQSGQGGQGGQAERLRQLAEQQRALRKQLQQLREGGGNGQALGDLERAAEQMNETIREMQRRRINPETAERQQQILSRLLQARQSLQKRGRKEQRRGQEADGDYTRTRPAGSAAPEREAERLRRSLIRSLESGYAPDYEQLIRRYFQLLQEQQDGGGTSQP